MKQSILASASYRSPERGNRKIVRVLAVVPEGDPHGVLRPDACNGRLPIVYKQASGEPDDPWYWKPLHKDGWPLTNRRWREDAGSGRFALALCWATEALEAACDKASRIVAGEGITPTPRLRYDPTRAHILSICLNQLGYEIVVEYDKRGTEGATP